jgi:hypothetical protein
LEKNLNHGEDGMRSSKKKFSEAIAIMRDQSNGYRFDMGAEYLAFFSQEDSMDVDLFLCDRYFICHQHQFAKNTLKAVVDGELFLIEKAHCEIFYNALLKKHGLIAGKVLSKNAFNKIDEIDQSHYLLFKIHILNLQFSWVSRCSKWVGEYLKTKSMSQGSLLSQNSVQLLLEKADSYFASARKLCDERGDHQDIYQELKKANHLLAKLTEGKTLLSANAVEMILVFEFLHEVYLSSCATMQNDR